MMDKIRNWIYGYLEIVLIGNAPERFLNLCRGNQIVITSICCKQEGYCLKIALKDYKKLHKIARKTKTIPRIKTKTGLPFLEKRIRHGIGFLLGMLMFFCLIFVLSSMLWHIEFQGCYSHTSDELEKYLHQNGIKKMVWLSKINCSNLEKDLRKQFPDIGWVSAERKGTRLLIRILEMQQKEPHTAKGTPVHLIASMNGTVDSIVTRVGTPMVHAGDKVKKGDILISGIVDIVGDNEIMIKKVPVIADGDVYLETSMRYQRKKPLFYEGKHYTGRKKTGIRIRVGKVYFEFLLGNLFIKPYENEEIIRKTEQTYFYTIDYISVREYEKVRKEHTLEEAGSWLSKKYKADVKKIMEKGVIIKQNNVKIDKIDDALTTKGTFQVLAPQVAYRKIEDSEWRIPTEYEYSGNND